VKTVIHEIVIHETVIRETVIRGTVHRGTVTVVSQPRRAPAGRARLRPTASHHEPPTPCSSNTISEVDANIRND